MREQTTASDNNDRKNDEGGHFHSEECKEYTKSLYCGHMHASFLSRWTLGASLGALLLVGTGCGATTPAARTGATSTLAGEVVATGTPTPMTSSTAAALASACDHPYYPLRLGYEIHYHMAMPAVTTVSPPTDSSYSMKVTAVDGASATVLTSMAAGGAPDQPPITSTQHISCSGGSLHAESYVDLGSRIAGGAAANQYHVTTLSATGDLLPPDVHVGATWSGSFHVRMDPTGPAGASPLTHPIELTVTMQRHALAEESVTVPAGTYTAMKVAAATDMGRGMSIQGTEWWVRGVGMIKSTYDLGMGAGNNVVTEATSVNIPN